MSNQKIDLSEEEKNEPQFHNVRTDDNVKEIHGDMSQINDLIGVYNTASSVHSKNTNMTRDYVLTKYDSKIVNEKFPRFVREQRKTLRIIKSFLIVSKLELYKKYNRKYADMVYEQLKKTYKEIEELLIGELDEMVIISRAGKGEVIDSMLKLNLDDDKKAEYDAEMEAKSKLMSP